MNQQKGFTLVELVVVIVVTGVLAAVATPKFMGISSDARVSSMEGIGATLEAQGQAGFAKSSMINQERSSGSSIDLNGQTLTTSYGYATAIESNLILLVGGLVGGDYEVTYGAGTPEEPSPGKDIAGNDIPGTPATGATATIHYSEQSADANCRVTYTQPIKVGAVPTIVVTTDEC